MGLSSLKVLSVCCCCLMFARKFWLWFPHSKSTPYWKADVRSKNADLALFLGDFIIISCYFFILKCQMLNPAEPCVSLSWTYSSAQVWFLPFFSHSSTKNNNPMFKQVKTSGCTWANRVNLWPYFSKQSTVQCWPTPVLANGGQPTVRASTTSIPTATRGASQLF